MSTFDTLPQNRDQALTEILLRLADDRLILGHRLSEWAGHAPELEEDLALANIALDMIGHASALYTYAAKINGLKEEDWHAYFRDDIDFKNAAITELPNGDFAYSIARLFLFSVWSYLLYRELTKTITDIQLKGMLTKHMKEIKYHFRHSREWVIRLGDGTKESHNRVQNALDDLWMYTGELFQSDPIEQACTEFQLFTDVSGLKAEWADIVTGTLDEATLTLPVDEQFMFSGSRSGRHTEHLGWLLAEMQFLRRSHPEADWI